MKTLITATATLIAVNGAVGMAQAHPAEAMGITQAVPPKATADTSIRAFRVQISEQALANLRGRIQGTQWPEKETVADQSQGAPLAMMRDLARYWATDYDWRVVEARLNALP